MNNQVCVRTAFAAVLEELAFMFADPPPANMVINVPETLNLVSIRYTGGHEGVVRIAADPDFCLALYENMVGASNGESSRESEATDAMKELCNVVTGQLVTMRFGTQSHFNLSIPELSKATKEDWNNIAETCGAQPLYVDQEHMVLVALEEVS